MSNDNIYIIGYMGSGKTTLGKELSSLMDKDFIDMDQVIEKEQGLSINQIFMKYGEHSFRNYEGELLDKLADDLYDIDGKNGAVISCGGGIILDDENLKVLRKVPVIWLDAKPEIMFERIKDNTNLPNAYMQISDEKKRLDVFTKQYDHRKDFYEEVSDVKIDTGSDSASNLAEEIKNKIEKLIEEYK